MLLDLDVQRGGGSADRSQILAVHVVGNAVSALGKAPQRNSATPLRRIEGVVHTAVLANRVSLRPVKTDVVQSPDVFSAREHFFFVDANPLFEILLACRRKVAALPLCRAFRPREVGSHDAAHTDGGGEIVLRHIDVVAEVGYAIALESLERLALRAYLPRRLWVGRNRHVQERQGEERIGRAARAKLDRKSTRLNSSHLGISYAVFCLKK